jgi:hypothetical protein
LSILLPISKYHQAKLSFPILIQNSRKSLIPLFRPLLLREISSPSSHHWQAIFLLRAPYYGAEPPYVHKSTGKVSYISNQLAVVYCMTSPRAESFISRLDQWISALESVKLLFQNQVRQLDSAIPELNSNQPSSLAIPHIQSVRVSLANQLSEVLREIADLNLVKRLLVSTQPSAGNYEHLFRLSDRQTILWYRAAYYQDLSDLFDSI